MGILIQSELRNLHAAVVAARLVESRASLFAGVDPGFVAGLAHGATPSDQLLSDLDAMNTARTLADGSMPLAIWLANALTLAGALRESAIFKAALEACRRSHPPLSTAPVSAAWQIDSSAASRSDMTEVRLFNLVASQEWTLSVAPATTLLQLIGELRALVHARPWTAPGVPKPGSAYLFRCYRSEADSEPLAPHTTIAELSSRDSGARLSLNVEWYRSFRGAAGRAFR